MVHVYFLFYMCSKGGRPTGAKLVTRFLLNGGNRTYEIGSLCFSLWLYKITNVPLCFSLQLYSYPVISSEI